MVSTAQTLSMEKCQFDMPFLPLLMALETNSNNPEKFAQQPLARTSAVEYLNPQPAEGLGLMLIGGQNPLSPNPPNDKVSGRDG